MADVTLPQLGETVTEGTITTWFKKVGDEIAEDEALFEVSTDKVDSEVPSPVGGVVTEIRVEEGDTVDVGTVVAVISDSADAAASAPAEPAPAESAAAEPKQDAPAEAAAPAEEAPAPEPAEAPSESDASGDSGEALEVTLPQLGETVTEGTITTWFKKVGDEIAEDEALFEVSTDKVDSEVPSPVSGRVTELRVPEGDTVDVGTVVAVISTGSGGSAPAAAADAPPASVEPAAADSAAAETPASQAAAPQPADAPAKAPTTSSATEGLVLSPVVRKLVHQYGVDVSSITGSGKGGRISRDDVQKYIEQNKLTQSTDTGASPAPRAASPAAPAGGTTASAASGPTPRSGERETLVPLTRIRKATAEHMIRSQQTSAHVLSVVEVDYENVERVRRAAKGEFKQAEGFSLTYLPFIARAVIDAVREYPRMNATISDEGILVKNYVNLGVAVDMDFEGLIVPVVQEADGKRLRAIAREVVDLAGKARTKKLSADDISNGTFTITNAGMYGTLITYPVINQPQVAILSTDGVRRRPVVVTADDGTESIGIHSVGNLALSWDHRVFDGAYSSAFLALVKQILETRDWSAELA